MTIRRGAAAPVQEAEVIPPPALEVIPPPSTMLHERQGPLAPKSGDSPPPPPPSCPLPAVETVPPVPECAWATPLVIRRANPAPVQVAASPTVIEPAWHAEKGQTLKAILDDWSKIAHVQLYWSTDYDYKLNTDVAFGGSYEDAVGKLLNQFSAVKPQPYGQLHRNPETGNILVVNTYGTYN